MSLGNDGLATLVALTAPGFLGGSLRSSRVIHALRAVDRLDFLPLDSRDYAYDDEALPIGYGQTCSQPSLVAFMLDKLDIAPGMRLLEVGSGSGYAAAIASVLLRPGGTIVACEILPELAAICRGNTRRWRDALEVVEGDGSYGGRSRARQEDRGRSQARFMGRRRLRAA
jgi:protein-L-isoaspartate(D-aspartate) O-methyltransferase